MCRITTSFAVNFKRSVNLSDNSALLGLNALNFENIKMNILSAMTKDVYDIYRRNSVVNATVKANCHHGYVACLEQSVIALEKRLAEINNIESKKYLRRSREAAQKELD